MQTGREPTVVFRAEAIQSEHADARRPAEVKAVAEEALGPEQRPQPAVLESERGRLPRTFRQLLPVHAESRTTHIAAPEVTRRR